MSWTESILWSVSRSLMIAFFGTLLAICLDRWLRSLISFWKRLTWGGLLFPFFIPSLMTGYCYRDTSMALVHLPWLREILYGLIVLMQAIPVAVVILTISPPASNSKAGVFLCGHYRLPTRERLCVLLNSRFRYSLSAFCLLFLWSFHETDLATLMQAAGWTEWMFTRHVGGLALRETVRLTLCPILIQLPFLIPVVLWMGKTVGTNTAVPEISERVSGLHKTIALIWLILAMVVVVIIPAGQILRGVQIGFASLFHQPAIPREIGDALLLASTTTACALGIVWVFQRQLKTTVLSGKGSCLLFCLLLPGLMGNFALGLLLAGIFQTSLFQVAYDTPVPLILGEVFVILPKTLILLHCIMRFSRPSAFYWIALMQKTKNPHQRAAARLLDWQVRGRNGFILVAIVWFWAYFEVLLPSLLAMPGLAPVGLVLYNHLHYGRITALGAKLTLMLLVPVLLTLSILILRHCLSRFK